ncbi:MAG: carboxypeptidase regulatory-like domain-containing protein [Bryobacterales bacterium]|nr:carboxypeptidase regulatory-like domain-containing protein [Bryobacterales bacterium]
MFSSLLQGQTGTGTVTGTVTDPSAAVLPQTKITLTNENTGVTLSSVSNAAGIYYFASVQAGPYRLTAEAAGFRRWTGTLTLQVGQTATIDPKMAVGAVETAVEVTDAAPVITVEGMNISDVKDALRIRQLPLNGRAISNLFALTPGVESGSAPRVNGLKVGSVELLLDGVSLNDRFGGGLRPNQPGLDSIEEFRIETTGSSAQYAQPATVTLVTKSGTNSFHGSVFETHRNNGWGLRARQRQDGNTPAQLIRNEYGASAGGPVLIPKLYNGRNRTFWFVAYEANKQRQRSFYRTSVPTAELWAGNFDNVIDASNRKTNIYDPLTTAANGTRTPFAGNRIPSTRIHPFFKIMETVTAEATSSQNPYVAANLDQFYPTMTDTNSISLKLDHRFTDKDSLSGRFTRQGRDFEQVGGRFGAPKLGVTDTFGTGRGQTPIHTAVIRENHIFSPTLFNEVFATVSRTANSGGTLADFTDWPAKLGLPNPFAGVGWPTLGAGIFGWDADNRKDEKLTAYNIENNATWIRGRHVIKFGGKARYEQNNIRELQQTQGSHTYGNAWTSLYDPVADGAVPFTGDGFASMALGLPTFLSNQYNRGYFYFRQKNFGLYVHDSFKVSSRLTLELGLRWDTWTPYAEKYDRLVNVDVDNYVGKFEVVTPKNVTMESIQGIPPAVLASWAGRGLTWKTAEQAGLPSNLVSGDYNNFGPRLGAAYRITDRFVMRAAYGEYFWTMPLSQILQASRSNPPLNLRFTNPLGTLDGTSSFAIRTLPQAGFYTGQATVVAQGTVILPPSAQSITTWDPRNWRDGRAQTWHFTLERETTKNSAVRLSYTGNHGRDLEQRIQLNPREAEYNYVARTRENPPANRDLLRPNKDWAFNAVNRSGISNTHSLQGEFEHRYSNGLAAQFFYTFTRSLTTTDAGGFTAGNGSINDVTGNTSIPTNSLLLGGGNLNEDQLRRLVYFNSTNVPAHRIRWNGVYDLPFGKGKKFGNGVSGALNHVIGGWQVASIGDWSGGNWLGVNAARYLFGDPTLSRDDQLLLTFAGRPQRLFFRGDFNPAQASNVDQSRLTQLVAPNQADRVLRPLGSTLDNRLPQTLSNGQTRLTPITDTVNWNARAFFLGPRRWNTDMSVFKNFQIREGIVVRFTADFFNAFNHPNDGDPNNTTGLQDLSVQSNDPRIIQFSLRLSW